MQGNRATDEVVIIDFETTGLSGNYDRVIEIGAAIVRNNEITSTFCSLCDPGIPIPHVITELTGITTAMVKGKPSPGQLMGEFYDFIGDRPLLAHNAGFDSRFLHAEMQRVGKRVENPFHCTMMLARRLMPECYDHKLGTLKRHTGFKENSSHRNHRALDDVLVTAHLWRHLIKIVEEATGQTDLDFNLFQNLNSLSKSKIQAKLESLALCK